MTMLPDIDSDSYSSWEQEQARKRMQEQISGFGAAQMMGDRIASLPSSDALTNPLGTGNAPPPLAPTLSESPPVQPASPELSAPPPEPSAPAPPALPEPSAPPPTDFGLPRPSGAAVHPVSTQDWIEQSAGAVMRAGGDVGSFLNSLSTKGDLVGNALGAAVKAGANPETFMSSLPVLPAPLPSPAAVGPSQAAAEVPPGGDLRAYARQAAARYGLDPDLFERQIQQESGFNPNAKSPAGAQGIAQFMPGTAAGLGVDPMHPYEALDAAAKLDAQNLQRFGSVDKMLAAYNAGPGAVEKYGGVPPFAETEKYVKTITQGDVPILGGIRQAGEAVVGAARGVATQISQFGDKQLTADEAYAACGPAAAVRFASLFGRNPSLREATDLAKSVGWTSSAGMAGIDSEQQLMAKLGIPTKLLRGAQWDQFAAEAKTGNPVTISTQGHYFFADGYDPSSGAFHVGRSGTDLKSGAEWMTPQQMTAAMGPVQGGLLADNPQVPAPSTADAGSASWFDRTRDTIGSSFSAAGDVASSAASGLGGLGQLKDQVASSFTDLSGRLTPAATGGALTPTPEPTPGPTPPSPAERLKSAFGEFIDSVGGTATNLVTPRGGLPAAAQPTPSDVLTNPLGTGNAPVQAPQPPEPGLPPTSARAALPSLEGPAILPSLGEAKDALLRGDTQSALDALGRAGSAAATSAPGQAIAENQANPPLAGLREQITNAPVLGGALGMLRGPMLLSDDEVLRSREAETARTMLEQVRQAELARGRSSAPVTEQEVVEAARTLMTSQAVALTGEGFGRPSRAPRAAEGAVPVSGETMLSSALTDLERYPPALAQQLRTWADQADAPASQVASTIRRWMESNPVASVPARVSGPIAERAVAELETELNVARGRALPGGGMPGQLGLPGAEFQPTLPETTAGAFEVPRLPGEAPGLSIAQRRMALEQRLINLDREARGLPPLPAEEIPSGPIAEQLGLPGETVQRALPAGEGAFGGRAPRMTREEVGPTLQQSRMIAEQARINEARAAQGLGAAPAEEIPSGSVAAQLPLSGMPGRGESVPLESVSRTGGNLFSRVGRLLASVLSPTHNLAPEARDALETYANMVGRQSDAVSVIAHNVATRTGQGLEGETLIRQRLASDATRSLIQQLERQGLAAPLHSAPFGFRTATNNASTALAQYAFHPDVATPLSGIVERSAVANNPLGRTLLNVAGTGKGTIFSLSNFHTMTEGLNAAFSSPRTLANYSRAFVSDSFAEGLRGRMAQTFEDAARAGVTGLHDSLNADVTGQIGNALWRRLVAAGVSGTGGAAAGYTEAKVAGKSETEARSQAFTAGLVSAALAGVPLPKGRGTVSEALQSALWQRAVPIAKMTAWDGLVKGGVDARVAAQIVNERFGGLNYAAMGRSPAFMDATRLLVMAPDWTESTVRQLGSALFGGSGQGVRAGFLAKALAGMIATTEVTNYALTGHSTVDNQPGHQFEIEMHDPAGGYLHMGLLPGNIQSYLNEANKLYADTSGKRSADVSSFITSRLSSPLRLGGEALQAATARNQLQMPYGVSKAGPAGVLASLSPVAISQIAQAIDLGGMDPKLAAAMAVLGLNPRYTNPNAPQATTTESGGTLPVPQRLPPAERLAPAERLPVPERVPARPGRP
jgi:hypothetical protein